MGYNWMRGGGAGQTSIFSFAPLEKCVDFIVSFDAATTKVEGDVVLAVGVVFAMRWQNLSPAGRRNSAASVIHEERRVEVLPNEFVSSSLLEFSCHLFETEEIGHPSCEAHDGMRRIE